MPYLDRLVAKLFHYSPGLEVNLKLPEQLTWKPSNQAMDLQRINSALLVTIVILLVVQNPPRARAATKADMYSLHNDLFTDRGYKKQVRPIENDSNSLSVYMAFSLLSLVEVSGAVVKRIDLGFGRLAHPRFYDPLPIQFAINLNLIAFYCHFGINYFFLSLY